MLPHPAYRQAGPVLPLRWEKIPSARLADSSGGKKYLPQHLRTAPVGKNIIRNTCGRLRWEKISSATLAEAFCGKKYLPQHLRTVPVGKESALHPALPTGQAGSTPPFLEVRKWRRTPTATLPTDRQAFWWENDSFSKKRDIFCIYNSINTYSKNKYIYILANIGRFFNTCWQYFLFLNSIVRFFVA